jgi:hypothetical protein
MAKSSAFQWHGHAAPTHEENLVDVVLGLRLLLVPRTLVLGVLSASTGAVHFLLDGQARESRPAPGPVFPRGPRFFLARKITAATLT